MKLAIVFQLQNPCHMPSITTTIKTSLLLLLQSILIHCSVSQEHLYLCTWICEYWPDRVENLQATSLAELNFSAESLRLCFDFQCSRWHFYDSGFGLLTEHSETSLLFFPSFSSLRYTKGHLLLFDKRCTPVPYERGTEAGRDGSCLCAPPPE